MNVDDTQHIVQLCETPVELQVVADTVEWQPAGCRSPEHVVGDPWTMSAAELVANCAISSSLPLNPSREVTSMTTTPQQCSPLVDAVPSTSSQPDVGTASVTGASKVVLVNGRAISVTSEETSVTQPPILAGCSRAPRLRRAATRLGTIGLSAPTLLSQKTTSGAPVTTAIGGSEADLKLQGAAERRQSGWARLRRWRSHRERTTGLRSPYCTPPDHWSPLGTGPSLPPQTDHASEPPSKSSQSVPPTTAIHRPSLRNTCGQYVREQLLSFSQPSDNRLSMKLFGSKNAFVREKLRRTAAASSPTGSSWLIHPCSNFR